MTRISTFRLVNGALAALVLVLLAVLGTMALAAQDKYTLKVPDGLAFSEFKGYEAWQVVSVSQDGDLAAASSASRRASWAGAASTSCSSWTTR